MEITRKNYYEIEPQILKDIEDCEFIAFDLELSGLLPHKFRILDFPDERFRKTKFIADNYRIIEFGIVPFIKNDNSYIAKPYNIFVFPSEKINNGQVDFEISAIIFNREHGCNFNKWICEGVPFLNNEQCKKLEERLLVGNINNYNPKDYSMHKNITLFKEKDRDIYNKFNEEFKKFYESDEKIFKHEKIMYHILIYFLNKTELKIINTIFIQFKDELIGNDKKSFIYIFKLNSFSEKQNRLTEEIKQIRENIKKEKGVKNLIEKIVEKNKPIVGHNCFVDVLFIMSHFICEIPRDYNVFKEIITNRFFTSGIFDTKNILIESNLNFDNNLSITLNKKNFHLEDLYNWLYEKNKTSEQKINIEIPKNGDFENYLEEKENTIKKFHQADYDAFATGYAYICMKNMLGDDFINKQKNKLNCINGIFPFYNLNGKEVFFGNSSDVYILTAVEGAEDKTDFKEKREKLLESKLINYKIEGGRDIINSFIIFISSENKNDFIFELEKYKEYFICRTIDLFKLFLSEKRK